MILGENFWGLSLRPPQTKPFFVSFFQILLVRWVGDRIPQEELAKFGYKSEKKVKTFGNHHAIFCRHVSTNCLNMAISKIILIIIMWQLWAIFFPPKTQPHNRYVSSSHWLFFLFFFLFKNLSKTKKH